MPSYMIIEGVTIDGQALGSVGVGFNRRITHDLLREIHGFRGLVISDWDITNDCRDERRAPTRQQTTREIGVPWGLEDKTVGERFEAGLAVGIDQFGGGQRQRRPAVSSRRRHGPPWPLGPDRHHARSLAGQRTIRGSACCRPELRSAIADPPGPGVNARATSGEGMDSHLRPGGAAPPCREPLSRGLRSQRLLLGSQPTSACGAILTLERRIAEVSAQMRRGPLGVLVQLLVWRQKGQSICHVRKGLQPHHVSLTGPTSALAVDHQGDLHLGHHVGDLG